MRRVLVVFFIVAAGCSTSPQPGPSSSSSTPSTTASVPTTPPSTSLAPTTTGVTPPEKRRPDGDFHTPPAPLPEGEPGEVIWVEELAAPGDAHAWNVLYLSEGIDGQPIATSGWVARSAAPGPHRILAFAHGTTGLGDECAPTVQGSVSPFLFADYLEAGWTVAFTDYQGLGTPGLHHYLVAEPAARSLFDAARAARRLDLDAGSELALFGFSQGGHAVLSATALAPTLAPDLELTHTVAAAPAAFLREWFDEAPSGQLGYLAMIGAGYADAYGTPLSKWLGTEAEARIDDITAGCLFDIEATVGGMGADAVIADVSIGTVAGDLLAANEPATTFFSTPLLLLTGGRDELFTPEAATMFLDRVCGIGIGVDRIDYSDASHTQVGSRGRADALAWLESDTASAPSAC